MVESLPLPLIPFVCQQQQSKCQSIECMPIAAYASANLNWSYILYNSPILRQNLIKLLYLHPNQTLFANIGEQRLLSQLHYLYIENSTSGSNWAAKHQPAFTKHTQKINLFFCKNYAIVLLSCAVNTELGCTFNAAKLTEAFYILEHYTCSPERLSTCMTNTLLSDFPMSLPLFLCMICLHKGKPILLHYTLSLGSYQKW